MVSSLLLLGFKHPAPKTSPLKSQHNTSHHKTVNHITPSHQIEHITHTSKRYQRNQPSYSPQAISQQLLCTQVPAAYQIKSSHLSPLHAIQMKKNPQIPSILHIHPFRSANHLRPAKSPPTQSNQISETKSILSHKFQANQASHSSPALLSNCGAEVNISTLKQKMGKGECNV
jgi:hypothetical protein